MLRGHGVQFNLLETLRNSEFCFYLTGSMLFRNRPKLCNDWDFFVEDSPGLTSFLEALDFRLVKSEISYMDSITSAVYEKRTGTYAHVQIVRDASHKEKAQKLLYNWGHLTQVSGSTHFCKMLQKWLWNLALMATE